MSQSARASRGSRARAALLVLGMLLAGTLNTLTTKLQFTLHSIDSSGQDAAFRKPWFGTLNMLLAMLLVGVIDKLAQILGARRAPLALEAWSEPLVVKDDQRYWSKVSLVAYPAVFDLMATAFGCIGILYVPASAWQMLRGACIIFSALFSVTFLKRRFGTAQWLGLVLCLLGVCIVGGASVLGKKRAAASAGNGASEMAFGIVMVLLGQVVQAAQVIAEEWLMTDVDLPAMQIVGFEGLWGTIVMLAIVYPLLWLWPGADHGHQEDAWDTLIMLSNSPQLLACMITYLFSCATYNATGIAVTSTFSAVHRMMLDASRTTVIWAFGLAVHMSWPESPIGEAWTAYSPLQLLGFLILVAGQAVYGEVLRVPCLTPAQESEV